MNADFLNAQSPMSPQFLRRCLVLIASVGFTFGALGHRIQAQEKSETPAKEQSIGWISMFDGKTLDGWKVNENPESVFVEEGQLVVFGKRAHAFYVGSDGKADFVDFHFKAKVKTSPGANSGIYFHTQFQASGWPNKGYEAQVNNTQQDKKKTGGLYAVQDNYDPPVEDDIWFDYEIIVKGKHIVIKINGKTISDYTEPDDLDRPNRCLDHGTFALQAHDPKSKVFYKDLKVKPLPRTDQPSAKQIKPAIKHSFLGVGKGNKAVIVNEDGNVEWKYDHPASDGWVLDSGNLLLALYPTKAFPNGGVAEVTREKKIVWQYQGQQKEISSVEPLGEDRYLVAELGPEPRAIVINRDGKVLQVMPFQCQKSNAHMQTRMLRQLNNGNWIAPHLLDFCVNEYKPETGEVVAKLTTDDRGREKHDWPFTAIRLKNGNTLVGCTHGNRVIELDSENNIVWQLTNDDLEGNPIADACGIQRLPNGNTIVSSYAAKGPNVKVFEVTPEKKIVWSYSGMGRGFHHVQILSTNGKAVSNNTMR